MGKRSFHPLENDAGKNLKTAIEVFANAPLMEGLNSTRAIRKDIESIASGSEVPAVPTNLWYLQQVVRTNYASYITGRWMENKQGKRTAQQEILDRMISKIDEIIASKQITPNKLKLYATVFNKAEKVLDELAKRTTFSLAYHERIVRWLQQNGSAKYVEVAKLGMDEALKDPKKLELLVDVMAHARKTKAIELIAQGHSPEEAADVVKGIVPIVSGDYGQELSTQQDAVKSTEAELAIIQKIRADFKKFVIAAGLDTQEKYRE